MTQDTVDGARAEAERRHPQDDYLMGWDWNDPPQGPAEFVAGAEWLAPTVAALEAEVARLGAELDDAQRHLAYHLADFRPGADDKVTGDLAVDMGAYATRQRARADAAEAVIERVRGLIPTENPELIADGYGLDSRDVLAALSDAAPQAVAAPVCESHGLTAADGTPFCCGCGTCPASDHVHGCLNDDGCCEYPEDHLPAAPEVVETAEELDALPARSVVIDPHGMAWQKRRTYVGSLAWFAAGVIEWHPRCAFPALVLYRPDATDGREGA